MEHTFYSSQWKWQELKLKNGEIEKTALDRSAQCKEWLKKLTKVKTNSLGMETGEEEVLWGSLVYIQDVEKEEDKSIFHFFVTGAELITVGIDFSKLTYIDAETMKKKMNQVQNAVEGFLLLISEITTQFLKNIDMFELELHDLFWKVKKRNNIKILDKIAGADQQLLLWKNLLIPVVEVRMAIKEAFGEEITEGKQYKLAKHRLERAMFLVRAYEEEIDSLLNFENLVSAHRGNEITKTLTVITTLFAPASVLGALWGMNFKHMPELEWTFGYLFAGILMIISTLSIYLYLRKKGWMGDILNTKNKRSFFR